MARLRIPAPTQRLGWGREARASGHTCFSSCVLIIWGMGEITRMLVVSVDHDMRPTTAGPRARRQAIPAMRAAPTGSHVSMDVFLVFCGISRVDACGNVNVTDRR